MPPQDGEDSSSLTHIDISVHEYLLPIVRALGRVNTPDYEHQAIDASGYLPKGQRIAGRHIVEEWLGDHAVSQLYRVRHATISTFSYALKVLQPVYAKNPKVLAQFHNEVSALARLQNPFLPRVIDMGVLSDGRPYQCFEIVAGVELDELIRERGALPEPIVWHIGADLLSILDELHENGLQHGSIQPSIIRLWRDPSSDEIHPRILDFTTLHSVDEKTNSAPSAWQPEYRPLLNPHYLGPERQSSRDLPACDIYAITRLLAALLDGDVDFETDSEDPSSPVVLGPNARASVIAPILERGLHPDPEERFANGGEMLREFLHVLLQADPNFIYQVSREVLERYGSNSERTPMEVTPRGGSAAVSQIFTPRSAAEAIKPSVSRVAHNDSAPATPMGTARMHKTPLKVREPDSQNTQTSTDEASSATITSSPTINYRVSFIIRIALILTFMLVALLILFLGLPS